MKNGNFGLWIFLGLALLVFPVETCADVVINEINYDPMERNDVGGSIYEFVEIYNPGPASVDLSGYLFKDGITFTFSNQVILNADAYLVLARVPTNSYWRNKSYPVVGPYEGKLSNGGEKLVLTRADGTIVDQLKYNDKAPWPRAADGYGPTLERIAWDLPSDDFHTWRASLRTDGTPGTRNSVADLPPRPVILAHEIVPKSPTSSNPVTVRVGLDAPLLIDSVVLQWETGQASIQRGMINADDTWKIWKGTASPSPGLEWTTVGYDDTRWTLGKGGFGYGDLELVNTILSDMRGSYTTFYMRKKFSVDDPAALGFLSLKAYYDDGFIAYLNGKEVTRAFAPDTYTHQSLSAGSHNADELETFDLGNAADLLQQGDNVLCLVGFNVSLGNSTDFVLTPSLHSSTSGDGDTQSPMQVVSETVNSATFAATIPAMPNQTLVRYNVKVTLRDGRTLLLPHAAEMRPFESFFVYDNDIPSHLPILWMMQDKVSRLSGTSRSVSAVVIKPLGDEPVQVFDGAIIRSARNGHKVKFLKGEEFDENRTLNFSLEAPREGTTAGGQSPHVEHISYGLYRDCGVLTPSCDWYRVIVNNVHSQRIAVQQPNENFIEMNGLDPDGNIYKIAYNEPYNLSGTSINYSKKTNLDEGIEDFAELFQKMNPRSSTLSADLRTYLDIEEFMGYSVATIILSHWDGIKNNIFLYHDLAEGGKWKIIPWDVDKTFGYTDSDSMYYEMPLDFFLTARAPEPTELNGRNLVGPLLRPFHTDPELNQEFVRRVARELDGLFSINRISGLIQDAQDLLLNDLQLIEQYTNSTNNTRRNQINSAYDTMRYFLVKRHEVLRSQLPVNFEVARSVPQEIFHAGTTISPIRLTVAVLNGDTKTMNITETLPQGFTAANIQATAGTVNWVGNEILWFLPNLTTAAELSYDLVTPAENPPFYATLTGSVLADDTQYAIPDVTLQYMPDNVYPLGESWEVSASGTWLVIDGVLNCFSEDDVDPKHAWVKQTFGTGDYTVVADVRMLTWVLSDYARAGISVRINPEDGGRGLNFLYHMYENNVGLLNDHVAWGPEAEFPWQVSEWCTMTLKIEGRTLQASIQKKGDTGGPFTMTWEDDRHLFRSPGFPGLAGGSMGGIVSQYDNFEVMVNGQVVFADDFNYNVSVEGWSLY